MVTVKDEMDANMNSDNPENHVTEVERNNRTVNERYCAKYHTLHLYNIY